MEYPGKSVLSFSERARLAGTIWNHGCVHVEYDKRSSLPRPRIHVTMKNPILYDYGKDTGGEVYPRAGQAGALVVLSVAIIGSYCNLWDDEATGNHWSDYNGTDVNHDNIGDTPYIIDANNRDRYPLMTPIREIPFWDTTVPTILTVSPQNTTYALNQVPLTFTVNVLTSWMGYSLDSQANVTVSGNTTLTGLSDGTHSLKLYAGNIDDVYKGNMGASSLVHFTIDTTPPSISIGAPTSNAYDTTDIQLTFTVSETPSWLGYSLDGQANVTITGNVTLTNLSAGAHSLSVYAKDAVGHTGSAVVTHFSVAEPLPVMWIVAGIAVPVVVIATVVMLKKRSRLTTCYIM